MWYMRYMTHEVYEVYDRLGRIAHTSWKGGKVAQKPTTTES